MNKLMKRILSLVLVAVMMILPISNAIDVEAQEIPATYNFITGVQLTDLNDNPLGNDVDKDADLRLTYDYSIPNAGDVQVGDTFTLTIPNQIKIAVPGEFDIYDDAPVPNIIGTGTLATDGTVVITFTNYAATYSNVNGKFWFDLKFDESKIGINDPSIITFNVGGTTPPVEITVNFDQPEPLPTSIEKKGTYVYNEATGNTEITWTVLANKENVPVNNGQVVDVIGSELEFLPGTVNINGVLADVANYTYDSALSTLTYNFPALINTQQTITFKTTVKDSAFTKTDSHKTNITEKNTATLNHDSTFTMSNEASVTIPVNFINKTGKYNTTTKQIDWTIVVNQNGVTIPNATITDTLPTGLTFFPGSVKFDGVASSAYTTSGQTIEFNLGSISEKKTIQYSTTVEDIAFISNTLNTYTNLARLIGTGVPGNATSGIGVGVPTSIIGKAGSGYDRATGEITWTITVNSNQISIIDPVITDEIRIGQEYVTGSASINGAATGAFNYAAASSGDTSKTGTLTYSFGTTIDSTYVITFKTKVTDPKVYAGNANILYYNTASITGGGITPSSSTGNQRISSQVVSKTGSGSGTAYDYTTRILTWRIVINDNETVLNNAVVMDSIPVGMEYIAGSATITGSAPATGFAYTAAVGDTLKSGTLTYTFASTINQRYVITFDTKITDLSIFNTNGDKTVRNSASLTHNLVPEGITSEGSRVIKNTLVSKKANYVPGKKYIDWTVSINENEIPIYNAVITDQLQEGLALDTTSVHLFQQHMQPNGTPTLGAEIPLTAFNVAYDLTTRLFVFNMPEAATGAYQLVFRTDVTDKTKSPFANQVKFNGTGTDQVVGSGSTPVLWAGSGSSGGGEIGSLTVLKVDSVDSNQKLAGAKFNLFDKYGNKIQEATSDINGELKFDRLRFNVPYTVTEIVAPIGYKLSDENYIFIIDSAQGSLKDIQYQFKNIKKAGDIRFAKIGNDGKFLQGAEFTLYNAENVIITTATSGINGEVLFSQIPLGTYTVKETKAPTGYTLSTLTKTVEILADGNTYYLGTFTNVKIVVVPPTIEIPDPQVPQGNVPPTTTVPKKTPNKGVTIMPGQVPLGGIPKTGDSIFGIIGLFLASGAMLTGILVSGKRKKKEITNL